MRALSATEAFTPALERTKALLRPYSLRRWLKLSLVAVVAELGGQFNLPPLGGRGVSGGHSQFSGGAALRMQPHLLALFTALGLVLLVVSAICVYYGSRMQCVLLEMTATGETTIAPLWRKHASHTWRWVGLKLLAVLAVAVALTIVLAAPITYLARTGGATAPMAATPAAVAIILFFVLIVLLLIFLTVALFWALRDFVLPCIALEDASLTEALAQARQMVRAEPGACLGYLGMKLLLTVGAALVAEMALAVGILLAALPLAAVGLLAWRLQYHGALFGQAVAYTTLALLALALLVVTVVGAVSVIGALLLFYQAYALYFLGGRYAVLGDLLEPPAQPMPQPEPGMPA
ncbi:MAG: hypothetical protein KGK08_01870 [Acidobacteriota bacterium]|nr:hypothetical protein [Acidobacteriota bacterium]